MGWQTRWVAILEPRPVLELELSLVGLDDEEELEELTGVLRRQLLELDVEDVQRVRGEKPPEEARSIDALTVGSLVVTLAKGAASLAPLIQTVRAFVSRDARREVEIEIDGDRLSLKGASSEEQERLVAAFLARHA